MHSFAIYCIYVSYIPVSQDQYSDCFFLERHKFYGFPLYWLMRDIFSLLVPENDIPSRGGCKSLHTIVVEDGLAQGTLHHIEGLNGDRFARGQCQRQRRITSQQQHKNSV